MSGVNPVYYLILHLLKVEVTTSVVMSLKMKLLYCLLYCCSVPHYLEWGDLSLTKGTYSLIQLVLVTQTIARCNVLEWSYRYIMII
jgi:hypothetical protein